MIDNVNELIDLHPMLDGGYITRRQHPNAQLFIYNYTAKAQYENVWNEATLTCRGLITDETGVVVSRPFRKFFNLEQVDSLPDEPFEVFEKLDGSLAISYWLDGVPYIATRGSFESEQAKDANRILRQTEWGYMRDWNTYLFEYIAPENRIVVDYGQRRELVLLAVIATKTGKEIALDSHWTEKTESYGFSVAKSYSQFDDIHSLKDLNSPNSEGFVIRFANGFRVKVKLSEYVRLHKLITGVTEKTILEDYLMTGVDLTMLLDRVPDEFNTWVRATVDDFKAQYLVVENNVRQVFDSVQVITRKEYAQVFTRTPYSAILFNMLDNRDYSQLIWKMLKPKRLSAFRNDEV